MAGEGRESMTAKNILRVKWRALAVAGALAVALPGGSSWAGAGDTGPVHLESVVVVEVPDSGHLAGTLAIAVRGGFTMPNGVNCSPRFISTLKTVDRDQRMFMLLTAALSKGKTVRLRITDDPALCAFVGECSLMWVGLDP